MEKENLFKLIRKEEVVVWAGAGMSLSAGMPSGKELSKIIINDLTKAERDVINTHLLLSDLTEEYCRLKGSSRNSLINLLQKVFISSCRKPSKCHKDIARIPHFKSIITTNYDTLIEDALGEKGQVIFSQNQIPYIDNKLTQTFKVHGNLTDPDSIIITQSDYNNFFKDNLGDNTLWTIIKERLATKSILFLGYNLEDPNVSVIFDKITEALGKNRRECFLVAPNLPKHKVNDLASKGIQYINCKAENLVNNLVKELKKHIYNDIVSKLVTPDTGAKFMINFNVFPEFEYTNSGINIKNVKPSDKRVKTKGIVKFTGDKKFHDSMKDYISGKRFGTFEILKENISASQMNIGGIKLPQIDNIQKLFIVSNPSTSSNVDFSFSDGFEYTDVLTKLYNSDVLTEIHLLFKSAKLIVKVNSSIFVGAEVPLNIDFVHDRKCGRIKDEVELYEFLSRVFNGDEYTIHTRNSSHISPVIKRIGDSKMYFDLFIEYFNNLRIIESYYGMRFNNVYIKDITEETSNTVKVISSIIQDRYIELNWKGDLAIKLKKPLNDVLSTINELEENSTPITTFEDKPEMLEIHGSTINLGYKQYLFLEPYIINKKEVMNSEEKTIRINGRSNKILLSYCHDPDKPRICEGEFVHLDL